MAAPIPMEMKLIGAMPCCFGFFFLFGSAMLLNDALQQYLLGQKIRNTPTSKARAAAIGLVELAGKAKCLEKLTAPITKTPCAYYEVCAQYYYQHKKSSGWRTFYRDESGKRFFLEDDSGKVLVDPGSAKMNLSADFTFKGTLNDTQFFGLLPSNQVDKKVLDYLEANPKAKEAAKGMSGKQLRFMEYYVAEGDPLFVLGSAEPLEGATSAVASENLVVRKNSRDKIMLISEKSEKATLGVLGLKFYIEIFFGLFMVFISIMAVAVSIGLFLV
ncbi:hypothetical protein L0Y65_01175 [Candidatus Micrarchaeota archaeon]|nr:hypothetical protein [Candidatus Micrarchaeota archaeon]